MNSLPFRSAVEWRPTTSDPASGSVRSNALPAPRGDQVRQVAVLLIVSVPLHDWQRHKSNVHRQDDIQGCVCLFGLLEGNPKRDLVESKTTVLDRQTQSKDIGLSHLNERIRIVLTVTISLGDQRQDSPRTKVMNEILDCAMTVFE